jgi:hypothetical protein
MIMSISVSALPLSEKWYTYSKRYSDFTSLSEFTSTATGLARKKTVKELIQHTITLRDAAFQLQINNTIKWMTPIVRKQRWQYIFSFGTWILPSVQADVLR